VRDFGPGDRLEAWVQLEIIGSVASGVWVAVALVVVSLCRAAKRGDYAIEMAVARELAERRDAEITGFPPTGAAS
jgi:hypothetical protein